MSIPEIKVGRRSNERFIALDSTMMNDIVTALREKADGDEAAAGVVFTADPKEGEIPEGVKRLAEALMEQAVRQRTLAEKLDDFSGLYNIKVVGEVE